MQHFMTYEFRYEFMHIENIVKSYLKSWVPRFYMIRSVSAQRPRPPPPRRDAKPERRSCYTESSKTDTV